jgi:hypothetical protein
MLLLYMGKWGSMLQPYRGREKEGGLLYPDMGGRGEGGGGSRNSFAINLIFI